MKRQVQSGATPALKKSLGQHFLHNSAIAQRITSLLEIHSEDNILEIGPGAGALTTYLKQAPCKNLVLLEKDCFWARKQAEKCLGNVQVLMLDALQFDWQKLCESGVWKIAGNLPYNIASPLIWDIVSKCHCLQKAVFMVQKEVAQRLCASPGNREYGALSVWVQCHSRPIFEFSVAPGNFQPPPKVDSAVVSFIPNSALNKPKFPFELKNLLNICFQNRRKQLAGIFKRTNMAYLTDALIMLGHSGQQRPEELACEDFMRLAEVMAKQKN